MITVHIGASSHHHPDTPHVTKSQQPTPAAQPKPSRSWNSRGLFALLLALSEGDSWGWDSYRILGLITVSVLSLALFVVIELEVADPLLDIRIFRYWAYTHSLMLITVLMIVMFGVLFYIPLFLQQAQGWGAFEAGLTTLP